MSAAGGYETVGEAPHLALGSRHPALQQNTWLTNEQVEHAGMKLGIELDSCYAPIGQNAVGGVKPTGNHWIEIVAQRRRPANIAAGTGCVSIWGQLAGGAPRKRRSHTQPNTPLPLRLAVSCRVVMFADRLESLSHMQPGPRS
ncbi:MAG: hypothetical protein D6775_06895 [Caldilineae bacterium]|nr:MAG: hypothetical protein D6775_06895 [Caldilineae bacterium]